MKRLADYIEKHFFSSFLTFFVPLFGIASLIFFVKIVSVTSVIHISFLELLELYIFILPQILFFTLPITFFVAALSSVYQLSFEFELIAIFALGIAPKKIVKIFAKNALYLTTLLLIMGLVLIPQAKQLYKGFLVYKRAQIQLNIKPSEFGHRFGDWYLFMEGKKGNTFINVALYNRNLSDHENFILAKSAKITNTHGIVELFLEKGRAYNYEDGVLKSIAFEGMRIVDTSGGKIFRYTDIAHYWQKALTSKKRAFDLSFFLFLALFPLASIYYIAYIGITNTRYEQKNIFLSALLIIALFFALAFGLAKPLGLYSLLLLPLWFLAGKRVYMKKIAKRY